LMADARRRSKETEKETQQRSRIEALENDLRRRQTSYIRRERAYQMQVEDLQNQLAVARRGGIEEGLATDTMDKIRQQHRQIMEDINGIHVRTSNKIKEKEKDLLRSFTVRLFDVQSELEAEKKKSNDESTNMWIKKYHKLEKEVDWVEELADKLEQSNKHYHTENRRLSVNFTSQEEDRALLVKQLVLVKRDNARYLEELNQLKESRMKAESDEQNKYQRQVKSPKKRKKNKPEVNNDERYKEHIRRLKHLLDVERKNQKDLRETYHKSLEERSQLENFLRHCIQDTKKEIARRQRIQSNSPISDTAVKISSLQEADGEKVMELLLSQERVISLLYQKTYPELSKTPTVTLPPVSNQERMAKVMAAV